MVAVSMKVMIFFCCRLGEIAIHWQHVTATMCYTIPPIALLCTAEVEITTVYFFTQILYAEIWKSETSYIVFRWKSIFLQGPINAV